MSSTSAGGDAVLCPTMLATRKLVDSNQQCCISNPAVFLPLFIMEPFRSKHRQRADTLRAVAAVDETSGRRRKDVVAVPGRRLLLASSR